MPFFNGENTVRLAFERVRRLTLVVEKRRLEGNQDVRDYTEPARVLIAR